MKEGRWVRKEGRKVSKQAVSKQLKRHVGREVSKSAHRVHVHMDVRT